MSNVYWARWAHLPLGDVTHLAENVELVVDGGRFSSVTPGVARADAEAAGAQVLPGVVMPGFANAHSHAFHRGLRGRTHDGGGTFWTWREGMYALAERLDPDSYLALARAVFAEMACAGMTTVGEFHYLHHGPGGQPYDDPNAMSAALVQAAREAGIRLTLLDTAYLAGGLDVGGHAPLEGVQRRFGDGRDGADVQAWACRWSAAQSLAGDDVVVGAAIHSVRAVPGHDLPTVVEAAQGYPLHVHVSEQPAENRACRAVYGASPVLHLADAGVLGPHTTAVHATHVAAPEVTLLGDSRTTTCICPTTERDLADGIGPARELLEAGSPLSLGSDQNAVVDMCVEARSLETHERLATLQRGRFSPSQLLAAATNHASLGWGDTGRLAAGARADLVAIRLDTPRTAGSCPGQVLMAATAADVDTVMRDGEVVVRGGEHRLGDVGRLLVEAIEPLWQ